MNAARDASSSTTSATGSTSADADVVFHLAAQADVQTSVARPDHDAAVNVVGTVHVLEAARRAGAQVVFSSTGGAIYGECDGPRDEDAPLAPLVAVRDREALRRGVPRRLEPDPRHAPRRRSASANVYGPRQDVGPRGRRRRDLPRAHARAASATTIFGDGGQTRDFVYVGDVVDALLAAVGHGGGVFNVGTGRETTCSSCTTRARAVAGSDAEPRFEPTRGSATCGARCSTSRATERELGWRPQTPLDDGLRATWDWVDCTERRSRGGPAKRVALWMRHSITRTH